MESTLSTGKAARMLGVAVKTLQRWEREGRLIPVARTDSNRRLYRIQGQTLRRSAYCGRSVLSEQSPVFGLWMEERSTDVE
jgi:predicted site-specific integrase-resolvase